MIKGIMVSTWKMSYEGLKSGAELLVSGEPVHRGILTAVRAVEDDPEYVSVGYGGLPNIEGQVELDAAYMDGDALGFGGIMAVRNIKNPIEVAYDLSRYGRNCLLAEDGAMMYAQKNGFEFRSMMTEKSRKRYEEADKNLDMERLEAYGGHDTVCVIGKDLKGSMACGVSTSGLFLKHPGRVGDSPIIGSGLYADSEIGCAAATGVGEDIMKGCLSHTVVSLMQQGIFVQEACEAALKRHMERFDRCGHASGSISVIAMDSQGRIGACTNKHEFPFVVADESGVCRIFVASHGHEGGSVFEADQDWLDNYTGD